MKLHEQKEGSKSMNATQKVENTADKRTVDTAGLQAMLSSGRKTAVEIGIAAGARIPISLKHLKVPASRMIQVPTYTRVCWSLLHLWI